MDSLALQVGLLLLEAVGSLSLAQGGLSRLQSDTHTLHSYSGQTECSFSLYDYAATLCNVTFGKRQIQDRMLLLCEATSVHVCDATDAGVSLQSVTVVRLSANPRS